MKNKLIIALMLAVSTLSASERMYIDEKEFDHRDCEYHIHTGENIWIETKAVHMNGTGLFTYERDVIRSKLSSEYIKKWKCPYCHSYWPEGTACQNAKCPSKYR